jgi:triosephosphate isomerase
VGLIHRFHHFRYLIGAQNCCYATVGAFTGENSPELLRKIGCSHVILGHSERRSIFNETDDVIYAKWTLVLREELTPIVCVGEKFEQRSIWKNVLADQLRPFLGHRSLTSTIFAYEPVWSIGTELIPTCSEIEDVLGYIRSLLGGSCPLLYGGSVNIRNAAQILACKNLDGLLIGRASLIPEEFKAIIQM